MPCRFRQPRMMNIHCSLVAEHICKWAKNDPYILAGDFNIKPSSTMYSLLRTGELDENHPEYPMPLGSDSWTVGNFKPMRSAYDELNGNEPAFTNYAMTEGTGAAFMETLDYIFMSDEWKVREVVPTPDAPPPGILSFPSADEPSDHILIGATLSLR